VTTPILPIQVPAALDSTGVLGLRAAIHAATETVPSVVVLEGTGGVFCRGLALDTLADGRAVAASVRAFAGCLEALRLAAWPSIAVVDGEALGGGLGLAAACDVVLATPRSTFGLPELLFGLLPAIVLPVLLERVPAQRLRLLALRAHSLAADEARALGLVDDLVAAEALPRATRRWVRTLSRPNTQAVALLKRYTAEAQPPGLGRRLQRGARLTARRLRERDVLAGARRLADGELAPWLA
jgi:enoyl-CoA hydratase/carnithine racemase